jgi:hypothetical protein
MRRLFSISGTGDGFGFPGYAPRGSVADHPADPGRCPAVESQGRSPGAPALMGFKYSGGAVTIEQLALTPSANRSSKSLANGSWTRSE